MALGTGLRQRGYVLPSSRLPPADGKPQPKVNPSDEWEGQLKLGERLQGGNNAPPEPEPEPEPANRLASVASAGDEGLVAELAAEVQARQELLLQIEEEREGWKVERQEMLDEMGEEASERARLLQELHGQQAAHKAERQRLFLEVQSLYDELEAQTQAHESQMADQRQANEALLQEQAALRKQVATLTQAKRGPEPTS